MRSSSIVAGTGLALVLSLLPAGEAGAAGRPNLRFGNNPILPGVVLRPQVRQLRPFTTFNGSVNPLAIGPAYVPLNQQPSLISGQFTAGNSFVSPFAGATFSPYNPYVNVFAPGTTGFTPFVGNSFRGGFGGYGGFAPGYNPFVNNAFNPYAGFGGYSPGFSPFMNAGFNPYLTAASSPYSFYTNPYSSFYNPYVGGFAGFAPPGPVVPGASPPGASFYTGY
jgi:hypothetical protein